MSTLPPKSQTRRRGYTLVELLIVVALIGAIAGMALPVMRPSLSDQVESAAYSLSASMSLARSLAVTNNSEYQLVFSAKENQITLQHIGSNTSLDNLPDTPFHETAVDADGQELHVFDLESLPNSNTVYFHRALVLTKPAQAAVDVTFNRWGGTVRSNETVVWLASGRAGDQVFIPIHIAPVTGLMTIGEVTTTAP